ncbi:MAG TPA: hypothetical protein VJ869_10190 [Sphaerochaeta sp.]|nr:hypothetical protein [Sphaerochaeta sp.]
MEYITLPSTLVGFSNTHTETVTTVSGLGAYLLHGNIDRYENDCLCPHCKKPMHIHNTYEVNLKHLCIGGNLSCLRFLPDELGQHPASRHPPGQEHAVHIFCRTWANPIL